MKMFKCDRCEKVLALLAADSGNSTTGGYNRCTIQIQSSAYGYDLCNECMEIVRTAVKKVVRI